MAQQTPKGQSELDDIAVPLELPARDLETVEELIHQLLATRLALRARRLQASGAGTPESRLARRLIAERREREALLGPGLFGEPAWDILLDLFAAEEENVRVAISSLCIAANVPPTTGLRWITSMVADGTLIRVPDPSDKRRVWIRLAPEIFERMRALLRSMRSEPI